MRTLQEGGAAYGENRLRWDGRDADGRRLLALVAPARAQVGNTLASPVEPAG